MENPFQPKQINNTQAEAQSSSLSSLDSHTEQTQEFHRDFIEDFKKEMEDVAWSTYQFYQIKEKGDKFTRNHYSKMLEAQEFINKDMLEFLKRITPEKFEELMNK